MLWQGFESSWPVMSTPDAGSAYELADKNVSWPGWGKSINVASSLEYNCTFKLQCNCSFCAFSSKK